MAKQGLCVSPDQHFTMTAKWHVVGKVAMDVLPSDVLLHIFDWYMVQASQVESWHTLVHVCRQWQSLVFGLPCCLNL